MKTNKRETPEIYKDVFIYYLRDVNGKMYATITLKKINECWVRGVSICDEKDAFCRKTGRSIAINRMYSAADKLLSLPMFSYKGKHPSKNISKYLYFMYNSAHNTLVQSESDDVYRIEYIGAYNCKLTSFEQEIVKGRN